MAEFQEVMRQFDRMCKAHAGCVDCPLSIKGTVETKCSIGSFIDESEYVEQEIMRWAAEHPEPVYPSWYDYLHNIGVLYNKHTAGGYVTEICWGYMMAPIDDDTAQKLGLQPKEGV